MSDNAEARDVPCCWKSLLKCIMNIAEILEHAKSYVHLVVEDGLLEKPQELKKIEK